MRRLPRPQVLARAVRKGGREIPFDQAITAFRDATAPGPAVWELGAFPRPGRLPRRGVSWFEAAAYCQYAGKALPTVHTGGGGRFGLYSDILLFSNFASAGPARVARIPVSLRSAPTYAGNVKECAGTALRAAGNSRGLGRAELRVRDEDAQDRSRATLPLGPCALIRVSSARALAP